MIFGAHLIQHSADAEADRAFVRDVLRYASVDAGRGWLIFALPPAELAFHPGDPDDGAELYLMTSDLGATMAELAKAGIGCAAPTTAPYGQVTRLTLPSGGQIGLYQPSHPLAIPGPGGAAPAP